MHVLLPTDGSDIALEAARRGIGLLGEPTTITLLSVVAVLMDTGGGIEGPVYTPAQEADIRKSENEHATVSLAATEAVVKGLVPASTKIEQRVDVGDPPTTITTVAAELAVDVIVVGSHGKGFLSRTLLGSVSEHVTRHAPCPVLVVRTATKS
jgi:nucleotide-binding universal stress UspA family protein